MKLRISDKLALPADFVTQTQAVLAKRGKGKSYTAMVEAEELTAAGLPWVAVDPMGIWYGLRAGADGTKRGGLPVLVLGGEHGDAPLDAGAGKVVAEFVAGGDVPVVLDTSRIPTVRARCAFVGDFLEQLLHVNRRPRHVFLEEADEAAPQTSRSPEQERSREQVDRLVRRGRTPAGLGATLISQRPAVLDKNPLTQTEMLAVLGFTAPQDIDAVSDWFKAHGVTGKELADVRASMPKLRKGQAIVSSPDWLQYFGTIQVREKRTYDSSATPTGKSTRSGPRSLADVDLGQLQDRMAASVAKAADSDPKALRASVQTLRGQVQQLQAQLDQARTNPSKAAPAKRVDVPVMLADQVRIMERLADYAQRLPDLYRADLDAAAQKAADRADAVREGVDTLVAAIRERVPALAPATIRGGVPNAAPHYQGPRSVLGATREAQQADRLASARGAVVQVADRPDAPPKMNGDGQAIAKGARRILEVLASQLPVVLSWGELAALAKLSMRGGTWDTYVRTLKRERLLVEQDGEPRITDKGMALVGGSAPPPPANATEACGLFLSRLPKGAARMAAEIIRAWPNGLGVDEVARRAEMAAGGGTFDTYLRLIRRNGVAEVTREGPSGPLVYTANARVLRLDQGPVDLAALGY